MYIGELSVVGGSGGGWFTGGGGAYGADGVAALSIPQCQAVVSVAGSGCDATLGHQAKETQHYKTPAVPYVYQMQYYHAWLVLSSL